MLAVPSSKSLAEDQTSISWWHSAGWALLHSSHRMAREQVTSRVLYHTMIFKISWQHKIPWILRDLCLSFQECFEKRWWSWCTQFISAWREVYGVLEISCISHAWQFSSRITCQNLMCISHTDTSRVKSQIQQDTFAARPWSKIGVDLCELWGQTLL